MVAAWQDTERKTAEIHGPTDTGHKAGGKWSEFIK